MHGMYTANVIMKKAYCAAKVGSFAVSLFLAYFGSREGMVRMVFASFG